METQGMAQDISLGDVVTIKGRKFVCEKNSFPSCYACDLYDEDGYCDYVVCRGEVRSDRTDVIYVEINNN